MAVQLVHPNQARKWLVLGHVKSPPHWTLLEIRWRDRKICFYDSFSRIGGYADILERSVRQFLRLCEELLNVQLEVDALEWVPETVRASISSVYAVAEHSTMQRDTRQTNAWDCGPFVAADACSLLDSDLPSTRTQREMADWRKEMETGILRFAVARARQSVAVSHSQDGNE